MAENSLFRCMDGNEAAASVAHRCSEVIAIYPITPSSNMGELADEWAAKGKPNLWGQVPSIMEMQSEGGAAGTCHGAVMTGSLTTTFTASQGLLLMIPNMYKLSGELTPTVFHVSARCLATHALSIFGDHSDVMSIRSCGWALLASSNVQEAHDMAAIAHAATLKARIPFMHFFDGFRTSHEVSKMTVLSDDQLRQMIDEDAITAHRERGLSPDRPMIRGTAQNPDVFFQGREACNPWYDACAGIVSAEMDRFAKITGRQYHLFDYVGAPNAERVIVIMGSGAETAVETAKVLVKAGEKVGVLIVRLYRPLAVEAFLKALPISATKIAVLDRTKEPGASGEPMFLDVVTALAEAKRQAEVIGGRYGLSSKEFTPAMVKSVFDELAKPQPKKRFTVGINDDVTHLSLTYDPAFSIESPQATRCVFFGLGSDGTVGANKNSIKIIGEETDNWAQGYFVYDSKKSGSVTVSHLRFGPDPVRAPYLIERAGFVACHFQRLMDRLDVLSCAQPGGTFLLNSSFPPEAVWSSLPTQAQRQIVDKKLRFFVINATQVAVANGMGNRINTVMQTCFFAISGVLPKDQAIAKIKQSIEKTYAKRGASVVQKNFQAVDASLAHLHEVTVPGTVTSTVDLLKPVPDAAPAFVRDVLGPMISAVGDSLPVSAMPADGTFPTGTTQWEKRALAENIPVWDEATCIQCGKCTIVCPHGCLRAKVFDDTANVPNGFKAIKASGKDFPGKKFTIQVSPDDCTGCTLCVEACPAKNKSQVGRKAINMAPEAEAAPAERIRWEAFQALPDIDRSLVKANTVKGSQLLRPLFEFSGACAGCGETPYVKLLSQLYGDRLVIANATGCSSIYGGNLPTTPWAKDANGRGPAWANSLFEDNAEFGLGMRLSLDHQKGHAVQLLRSLEGQLAGVPVGELIEAPQKDEAGITGQRMRVALLKQRLATVPGVEAKRLLAVADSLVDRSVWILGGDGWAYDIGFGGLDHVLASGEKVRVLVMDTEVYSNTGGQASKSTPRGAVAKFAAKGKATPKKDLALMAMSYGYVYVARIAMGANDAQTVKAFAEAEAHDGPSLIIAYSHCIAHGIDMRKGLEQQKLAVQCGHWPLYRFNPDAPQPMTLDSGAPTISLETYTQNEGRYRLAAGDGGSLMASARTDLAARLLATKRYVTTETANPAAAGEAKPVQGNVP